jgi:hypothetical protein
MVAILFNDKIRPPRPVWERLHDLCQAHAAQMVICEGELGHLLRGHRAVDRRGLLLWTEERLHTRVEGMALWAGEMLGLRGGENWSRLAKTFEQVTRSFFSGRSDYGAWVFVESCRDYLKRQSPGLSQTVTAEPVFRPYKGRRRRGLEFEGVALPAAAPPFMARGGVRERGTRLAALESKRLLWPHSQPLGGLFKTWCLADPSDDRPDLAKCWVPAGTDFELALGVNGGRLVNWVKMDCLSGWVESFTVDVCPQSGELFSVRHARVELRLLAEMHHRLHSWLQTALRGMADV